MLDIAKIESGKIELHYETFLVSHIVSEVEAVIRSLTDKKRQTLVIRADDVPFIVADRVKFKQILYNLLSNAVKFTPEDGTITLDAEVTSSARLPFQAKGLAGFSEKNNFLKLSVKDSGIGIKPEDMDRIFSEFEQVDSGLSRKYEGTGLGLALTKRLVELHGGEIFVESTEGMGSTFTIVIPLTDTVDIEKSLLVPDDIEKERFFSDAETRPMGRRGEPLTSLSKGSSHSLPLRAVTPARSPFDEDAGSVSNTTVGNLVLHRVDELDVTYCPWRLFDQPSYALFLSAPAYRPVYGNVSDPP